MKTIKLNDISRTTTSAPLTFVATSGKFEPGKKLDGALSIGTATTYGKGTSDTKPFLELYPDIGIDSSYSSFFHADRTNNQRFDSFSDAAKAFNELVLSKNMDPEEAKKYMLRNVPLESKPMVIEWMRGQGYRAKPESCIVLDYEANKNNPEENFVLIYKDGKYGVADKVSLDGRGLPDLRDASVTLKEDINEVLAEYATKAIDKEFGFKTSEVDLARNVEEKVANEHNNQTPRNLDDDDAR